MFTPTCESFIAIGWTVCAPVGQHRVLQLVQFLNFQNHSEHVYGNLWKFHHNRMNGPCACMATSGTPASTIFFYFQNHREHVYNNLWKFHRNRMIGVCSYRDTDIDFYIYILNFQNHREHVSNNFWKLHRNRWTVCAPVRQHRVLQLVQF